MAYKDKYFYIDEDGNKKKYIGKIIQNKNSYNGILTVSNKSISNKELIYHPEVKEVKGYLSYYSYINSNNEEVRWFDNFKKDEEDNKFFTYTERNLFHLEYNPAVEAKEEYFSYIDPTTGEEKIYSGSIIYNKRTQTYTGIIQK